jgi:hypothetical protein
LRRATLTALSNPSMAWARLQFALAIVHGLTESERLTPAGHPGRHRLEGHGEGRGRQ